MVSLELAAVNMAVQDAIRPDKAAWDLVVFDEAHRLTPTAAGFHQVGRLLAKNTPRALLMTATPIAARNGSSATSFIWSTLRSTLTPVRIRIST